jgi:hypothetical protein
VWLALEAVLAMVGDDDASAVLVGDVQYSYNPNAFNHGAIIAEEQGFEFKVHLMLLNHVFSSSTPYILYWFYKDLA